MEQLTPSSNITRDSKALLSWPREKAAPSIVGEQVAVTGDDDADSARVGAGEELVVVGIGGDGSGQRGSLDDLGLDGEQREERLEVGPGTALGEEAADTLLLVEHLAGVHDLDFAISPGVEDAPRNAPEEEGRDEDVGVENDPHRRLRAFATARFTSAGFTVGAAQARSDVDISWSARFSGPARRDPNTLDSLKLRDLPRRASSSGDGGEA